MNINAGTDLNALVESFVWLFSGDLFKLEIITVPALFPRQLEATY